MAGLLFKLGVMNKEPVKISVKGVMPTSNGCAVFLGNDHKTFVIYVDPSIGNAISMALNDVRKPRPLTHDLILSMLLGLGVEVKHILINDEQDGTFFARIVLDMSNELGRKVVEVDARPSDSIALALQAKAPMFVCRSVFDAVEDMTEILERILKDN